MLLSDAIVGRCIEFGWLIWPALALAGSIIGRYCRPLLSAAVVGRCCRPLWLDAVVGCCIRLGWLIRPALALAGSIIVCSTELPVDICLLVSTVLFDEVSNLVTVSVVAVLVSDVAAVVATV